MKSILILLHCQSNTGYAIGPLEKTFFHMAQALCGGDVSRIHFAYPSMKNGPSPTLPTDFAQYVIIDATSADPDHLKISECYIREHDIDTLFGFDQCVNKTIYRSFRRAGIRHFMSYWGAPMSSINIFPIRLLKRMEVLLRPSGPDHYIFESHGMAEFAIKGRGIPPRRVSVVPLGVDHNHFKPDPKHARYIRDTMGIPAHRRIFYYSGHMEPRKGVAVIMEAANILRTRRRNDDWHVFLCGNKEEESHPYERILNDSTRERVTFGGYRSDTHLLQRGCFAALIASTGWDSFPRSGLEMQASGLPLVVSGLRGLRESVEDGVTGIIVEPGNAEALALAMEHLLDHQDERDRLGRQARVRIEEKFTLETQLTALIRVVHAAL
jgi:glycosyltransferase involved in cell wall biosynthesis